MYKLISAVKRVWTILGIAGTLSLVSFLFILTYGLVTGFDFVSSALAGVVIAGLLYAAIRYISKKNDSATAATPGGLIKEDFRLAGCSYYAENIAKLAMSNPDWKKQSKVLISEGKAGKNIFRYNYIYKPVKLIPEPNNEHDHNAIMVQIAGEKVGYISSSENLHVKELLKKKDIKYISAFISGGDYKVISEDATIAKGHHDISINIRIAYS